MIVFVFAFILTFVLEIYRGSEFWWVSFFFLIIGVVVIPIGNYMSWNKKFNR
jgi:uncharacterized membrane protein YczE